MTQMLAVVLEACIPNYVSKNHDKSAVHMSGVWGFVGNSSSAMPVHLRGMTILISYACQVRLLLVRI